MRFLDIDYKSVITVLWDFVVGLATWTSKAWEWLNEPIVLGIDSLDLGFVVIDIGASVSFTPIYVFSGGMILTLIVLGLVKSFIPVA